MMLGFVRGAIHRSLFDLISVCREAVGRGRQLGKVSRRPWGRSGAASFSYLELRTED